MSPRNEIPMSAMVNLPANLFTIVEMSHTLVTAPLTRMRVCRTAPMTSRTRCLYLNCSSSSRTAFDLPDTDATGGVHALLYYLYAQPIEASTVFWGHARSA